eukprot:scaffold12600_cov172-Skeletonema_dohrnii-CCMP3373.AAC.3
MAKRNWKKRTRTIDDNEFLRWGERTKRKRTIFRTRMKTILTPLMDGGSRRVKVKGGRRRRRWGGRLR